MSAGVILTGVGRQESEGMEIGEMRKSNIPMQAAPSVIDRAIAREQQHMLEAKQGKLNGMLYDMRGDGRHGSLEDLRNEYIFGCIKRIQQMRAAKCRD